MTTPTAFTLDTVTARQDEMRAAARQARLVRNARSAGRAEPTPRRPWPRRSPRFATT